MNDEVKQLSKSGLEFALDLFKELGKDGNSNVLLSPVSIGLALSVVYAGSKTVTNEELKKMLHLEDFPEESKVHATIQYLIEFLEKVTEPGLDILLATRLYLKSGMSLMDEFQKIVQTHYHSDVESVTFDEDTRKAINVWVESKTNEKIKDLIGEGVLTDLTRMVLVNAVYFKGNWKTPFDASRTHPQDFYVDADSKVTVDMMHNQDDFYFAMNENLKCQILGMPYVNENLLMYIILPDEKDGLAQLESALTTDALLELIGSTRSMEVNVTMPKFKMEWGSSLEGILSEMGLGSLFSESDADLSGMTGQRNLYVSTVIHKSFIEVNEEGTEAAAATAVVMMLCCLIIPPNFVVDHPFLLLIHEKRTNTILFLGRVVNPLE